VGESRVMKRTLKGSPMLLRVRRDEWRRQRADDTLTLTLAILVIIALVTWLMTHVPNGGR
jgi:hypothetical protein